MEQIKRLVIFSPAMSASIFLVAFCNAPLWRKLFEVKGGISVETLFFYTPFFIVLTTILILFFSLFNFKYLFKGIIIIFLIMASTADYFMTTYGVVIDKTMLQNALETNPREALELLNANMVSYIIILGISPSFYVWRYPSQYQPIASQLLKNGKIALLCLGIILTLGFFFYGSYTSIYRNDREIRYLISPLNVVDSAVSNIKRKLKSHHAFIPIGTDATLMANRTHSARKNLTILVIGETARAANFSLDGYARQTNPLLSRENVVNFSQVYSCGTATAVSVPCMFSAFGRESYDSSKAEYTENLVDVLTHAGVKVLWRNNNDSCKGVCNRITYEDMSHLQKNHLCNDAICYDEVLLYHLQDYLDKLQQDGVIVLHQQGSHGPGYNLRHPNDFKTFTPECSQAILNDCSQQELINAYDNTIVYTDFFLVKVINFLKANAKKYNTAMLYVSDHGESLGENNLYLHGLPYFVAPDEQKHVPMISWFSREFVENNKIDIECLKRHGDTHYSHDNLFHSMLGVMGIATQVYNAKLDIFAGCRV